MVDTQHYMRDRAGKLAILVGIAIFVHLMYQMVVIPRAAAWTATQLELVHKNPGYRPERALVVGGAAGNMLDRLISDRGVVDFIDVGVGASRFFIFNVADAGVSVGAALLIIATWRNERQRLADTGLRA